MTRSEPDYEVVALRRALDECRQHHADTVAGLDPHTGPAATVGFRDRERGRAMTEQTRREIEALPDLLTGRHDWISRAAVLAILDRPSTPAPGLNVEWLARALNASVGTAGWLHLTPPSPVEEWRENARIIAAEYAALEGGER